MGAASTPASPAKNVLTAHTPIETAVGLVPDRSVMAGESTMARTLRPDVGVPQDDRPHDDGSDDAGVDDDLVEGDGDAEELVDRDGLGRQARCLLDGLVAEDQRGEGGDGDEQPDRRHHLDQRRRQPQVTEEDGVEQDPERRAGDHDGDDGGRRGCAQSSWVCR